MAIEIHLHDVKLQMRLRDDGIRDLALVDPLSGITVRLQLPEDSAKHLAAGLTASGIVPASASELGRLGGI